MKYYYIIFFFLAACSNGSDSMQSRRENSPSLIHWSHEYVMSTEDGDRSYSMDHENFIREYFSVQYKEKQIVATTLIRMQSVDSIVGKINVSNDTIYLIGDVIMTDDSGSTEYHKFKFVIRNPENKRFKVVSSL